VLKACDALDGVKDGVLEDPTRCQVDPKDLGRQSGACMPQRGPRENGAQTLRGPHCTRGA
jgi:hypothetical protein